MNKAFNGDQLIWEEFISLVKEFDVEIIIETGTYKGDSTIEFAKLGMPVHTTEIRKTFHSEAVGKFQTAGLSLDPIFPHFGDSAKLLNTLVPNFARHKQRIILFLDAHWYGDNCLERELKVLMGIDWQGVYPVILIHDMHVPGESYGFDIENDRPISMDWIEPYIYTIYDGKFQYYYNTGICNEASHNRGCAFIYPTKQS